MKDLSSRRESPLPSGPLTTFCDPLPSKAVGAKCSGVENSNLGIRAVGLRSRIFRDVLAATSVRARRAFESGDLSEVDRTSDRAGSFFV